MWIFRLSAAGLGGGQDVVEAFEVRKKNTVHEVCGHFPDDDGDAKPDVESHENEHEHVAER